ncbi:MAG TPA: VWA domain-containing protein [Chthoniobacterales bacterium]|jgi:Ca-activated chloride channel family protein
MISDFYFLRPWWFAALIPAIAIWLLVRRRQNVGRAWRGIIAAHLLPHLLSGETKRTRFSPLMLIGMAWIIAIVALAGPTWRREPAPFADDTAALAIIVKVTPSMVTEDVQPNRLARAVQKIHDLLGQRRGAKTTLIAYAGTAHVVMPATTDEEIINTFAAALDPKIMPDDGDVAADALKLADETLKGAGGGSILWITDSVATEQSQPIATWRKQSATSVRLLPPLLEGAELGALHQAAKNAEATFVRLTPDDADVRHLAREAKFSSTASNEGSNQWEESGYWLTPLLAIILLFFFRSGWMVPTAARS